MPAWRDRPHLEPALAGIWRAFQELDRGRGEGGIPPSEVRAWLDEHRIHTEWRRRLYWDAIHVMDRVWLEHHSAAREGGS